MKTEIGEIPNEFVSFFETNAELANPNESAKTVDFESGEQQGGESETFTIPPLYGDHTPAVELQRENTRHRMICYLAAQGLPNNEIAKILEVSPVMVGYTKKQPWAQKLIAEMQDNLGRKMVFSKLHGACMDAVTTLIEVSKLDSTRAPNVRPADRAKAANMILDRIFGTAPQTVRHENVDPSDLTDEELSATIRTGNS